MGRGCSSILQVLASVVAVVEIECGFSVAASERTCVCATRKETAMRGQCTVISKNTGVFATIGISAKCMFRVRCIILAATLLMFGCGDGLSPSALAYSVLQ